MEFGHRRVQPAGRTAVPQQLLEPPRLQQARCLRRFFRSAGRVACSQQQKV